MTAERTRPGLEVEAALNEVLSHLRGETELPCRIVDDPSVGCVRALREPMGLSRGEFAQRFALDAGAVQDWGRGRPNPNRAARALGS